MSFFKKLFSKSPAPPPAPAAEEAPRPNPPELKKAIAALDADDFETALREASRFTESPSPALFADANRLCALATARLNRWDASFAYWLALFNQAEPTAHNALQLATTSVKCGQIDRGQAWFEKTRQLRQEQEPQFPIAQAYANFLSSLAQEGHFQQALPYLEWLRDVYGALAITDDTFLYMRGVPFFSDFVRLSPPIVKAALPPGAARAWYQPLLEKADEQGQAALSAMLTHEFPPA